MVPSTQNITFLSPFHPNVVQFTTRPTEEIAIPEVIDGEPEWEIEKVTDFRQARDGSRRYKVKWVGAQKSNGSQKARWDIAHNPSEITSPHKTFLSPPPSINSAPAQRPPLPPTNPTPATTKIPPHFCGIARLRTRNKLPYCTFIHRATTFGGVIRTPPELKLRGSHADPAATPLHRDNRKR